MNALRRMQQPFCLFLHMRSHKSRDSRSSSPLVPSDIRSIFMQDGNHDQFRLHDIDQSIVEADIRTYLEFRLSAEQISNALPYLRPPTWQPTKVQMDTLVGMCGKLFIIAATATTFILDGKHADPARQFAVLLDGVSTTDFSGAKHNTAIDKMYMGIIRAAQPDPVGDWAARFQTVVGTIVLLCDPLPCDALAQLSGVMTSLGRCQTCIRFFLRVRILRRFGYIINHSLTTLIAASWTRSSALVERHMISE